MGSQTVRRGGRDCTELLVQWGMHVGSERSIRYLVERGAHDQLFRQEPLRIVRTLHCLGQVWLEVMAVDVFQ